MPAPLPQQVDGLRIAAELGCGVCHRGMPEASVARDRTPGLGPSGDPLPADFIFDYLANPLRRRSDIGRTRMPDFALHEGERVALALYLGTAGEPGGALALAVARNPEANAEAGARIFSTLGCAGCHEHSEASARAVGPDLSGEGARVKPEWLERYLATPRPVRGDGHPTSPGARMPDFDLDAEEVDALRRLLLAQGAAGSWTPDELTPFQVIRTARLVEQRLACKGCHRISGDGGRIGPPLDAIAERLLPSFVLEIITDPGRVVPGAGMPRQHLEPRDARRVASYLVGLAGASAGPEYSSLVDPGHPAASSVSLDESRDLTEGASLYSRHCASCHGVQGKGDGFNARNLPVPPTAHANAELMARRADDTLFDGIYAGAFVLDGSARMPAFGSLFTPDQVRALVAHIRSLCDCEGPAWSRDGGASW